MKHQSTLKYHRLTLFLAAALFLSACATSSKVSICPKSKLGQCMSMGQVNDLVDQGAFETTAQVSAQTQRKKTKQYTQQSKPLKLSKQLIPQNIEGIPLRKGEEILEMWLAPYEDHNGNYISGHSVFSVVAPATWIPVPSIQATPQEDKLLTAIQAG